MDASERVVIPRARVSVVIADVCRGVWEWGEAERRNRPGV